jgi:hypothetical protein
MALIEKLPDNANSISVDQQTWIALTQLVKNGALEQLIEAKRVVYKDLHNRRGWLDIPNLQDSVDSQKSYQQRKTEIEHKATDNKSKSLSRIRDLRSMIVRLRTTKLNELMRLNANQMERLFEGFGDNGDLARFLILEGHLDDTYYQFTSLFHSGRLSPNDNKFLIQIRAFATP